MNNDIKSLKQLADHINLFKESPFGVLPIIWENGWIEDTDKEHGVCHNANNRVILDMDGTAIVVDNEPVEKEYQLEFFDYYGLYTRDDKEILCFDDEEAVKLAKRYLSEDAFGSKVVEVSLNGKTIATIKQ